MRRITLSPQDMRDLRTSIADNRHQVVVKHTAAMNAPFSPRLSKFVPKRLENFINDLNGTVKIKPLGALPDHGRARMLRFCAQGLHDSFKQDDERYETVESTEKVIKDRMQGKEPSEEIFVTYFKRSNIFGKSQYTGISTGSLVPLDSPEMPQYGKGWLADLFTEEKFRKQGFGTQIIEAVIKHAETAGVEGGVKLYAEQDNAPFYKKRGFHEIGKEDIPNQDAPGETIPVTIFSSKKPATSST